MKKINLLFILSLFALITFNSCQDEVIEVTEPSSEETIVAGSSLAVSMMRTATNDGSGDNIIDNANCLSVELPVTVVVNGVEIIIDSEEDYDLIEAVFDEFDDDNDVLEIQFPIVIILSDYSEITIESYEELEVFIQECTGENEVDDDIECIDFVYPISISIYNANFQVIDTVVIQSDEQLYFFIEELEGGVLASINFPITMVLSNGNEVVVNNNAELEAAIEAADGTCDEDDDNDYNDDDIEDCDFNLNGLASYLMECPIEAYFFTSSGSLINTLDLVFGDTVSVNGDPAVTETTSWILTESDEGYVMTIEGLVTFNTFNGTWLLEGCDDEYVYFTYDGVTMKLEQNCENTPFDCFDNISVTACDYNGDDIATFELETLVLGNVICDVDFSPSFHLTMEDAQNNTNPIAAPNSFENTTNPQTVYLRIESNSGNFEVYEIELIVASCVPDCTELDVDGYLQECVWNIVSLNGDDNLIEFDLDFMANQGLVVTGAGLNLQGTWSTSQSANGGVEVVIDGIAGPNIQAINGSWMVIDCASDRLEMIMGDNTIVMEQYCENCENPGYLTNDLIIYIPFSTEIKDLISGYSLNTFTNSFVEDRSGNATCAIAFDGNNAFSIPVTEQNKLLQGDNFSVSIWFKMTNNNIGDLEAIFQKGEGFSEGFQLAVYDLNTPLVSDTTSGYGLWDNDWNQEVDVVWDNSDWHHLVVTRDSNNTIRLYRDGVLRNIDENSNFDIDSDPLSNYLLGDDFTGALDDLRVYKRTLSDNEVGDLYNLNGDCYQCL